MAGIGNPIFIRGELKDEPKVEFPLTKEEPERVLRSSGQTRPATYLIDLIA